MMKIQLLRNAAQVLTVNGKMILIDPMLAPKGSYEPFKRTSSALRNPLVDLPLNDEELRLLLTKIDAVLLTHIHLDHWEIAAQQLLPKDMTIFCQPEDIDQILKAGFTYVYPIEANRLWNDISFYRTGGRHGTGEIGKLMGTVSGYVIKYQEETVYIAGDTIWCEEVKAAIDQYQLSELL